MKIISHDPRGPTENHRIVVPSTSQLPQVMTFTDTLCCIPGIIYSMQILRAPPSNLSQILQGPGIGQQFVQLGIDGLCEECKLFFFFFFFGDAFHPLPHGVDDGYKVSAKQREFSITARATTIEFSISTAPGLSGSSGRVDTPTRARQSQRELLLLQRERRVTSAHDMYLIRARVGA